MQTIREITALETFPIRHPVLRTGKPLESCHFEGDSEASTKHFGYFSDENLVGVASLFQSSSPILEDENQFQLRGMAVLESFQKKGIGESLVKFAENDVKNRNGKLLWFNAREIAVPFYQKLGYEIIGEPFDIEAIGKHFIMSKVF